MKGTAFWQLPTENYEAKELIIKTSSFLYYLISYSNFTVIVAVLYLELVSNAPS